MPFDFEGFQNIDRNRQMMAMREQEMQRNAMLLDAARRAQAVRPEAGRVLYDIYGGQGGAPQGVPTPPPMPAPQPGAMSPGGGNPAAMGAQPQAVPAAPVAPPQIPPFRALPAAAPAPAAGGTGMVPPPPTSQGQPGAQTGVQQPRQFDLKSIIENLKKTGVPSDRVMDMLDVLQPSMTAENQRELKLFQQENAALRAAVAAYTATINAETKRRDVSVKEQAEERRGAQGQQRIDLLQQKLNQAAQGGTNLKSHELVYPKGPDGNADLSQGPIGIRGVTKSGKIVTLDHEGNPVATLGGVTAKEGKSTSVKVRDTVRANLVQAGAKNAIDRLNEIEKKFPKETTSILFSTHPEGITESAVGGVIRGTQSEKQQKVDAAWASFIDEAIPVFTGGLRGSDAFRRFLISQAPTIGTKGGTITEKMRLLRANITATADVFAGKKPREGFDPGFVSKIVNEFASNPKYWGPGVTKQKAEEARAAVERAIGGGGAEAPQPGAVEDGYRFKGGDPSDRANWEPVS